MLIGRIVCTSWRPSCIELHSASLTKSIFLSLSESVESDISVGQCCEDLQVFVGSIAGSRVSRMDSLVAEDVDVDDDDVFVFLCSFLSFFSGNFPDEDDDALASCSGPSEMLSAESFVSNESM